MADGIGLVNFFQSIISYITLFTCIGIPMYATREISRIRDNKKLLSKTSVEILILHGFLTIIGYIAIAIICSTVAKVQIDIPLFLLLSTNIFFTAIGCDWLYYAIEDFKYITIRGIIVRLISVILLFTLVKTKNDLFIYAAISTIGGVGSNIFNFVRLRKFIKFNSSELRLLQPQKHLKPSLKIFALNLIISIYVNLDSVMLGFMKDTTAVGYYTSATKLTKMILGIITSLSSVTVPRFSNLYQNGQLEEFKKLAQKAIDFVMALSLPLCLGLMVMSPTLINLFCGPTYTPAIITLKLISPIILFISLSDIIGIQVLYPQGKENIVMICTGIGAFTNFILNLILIPQLNQNGAAIATSIAEFLVSFSMIIIGYKYIPFKVLSFKYYKYFVASIIMCLLCYSMLQLKLVEIINLLIIPLIGIITYCVILYLLKDQLFLESYSYIIKKLKR